MHYEWVIALLAMIALAFEYDLALIQGVEDKIKKLEPKKKWEEFLQFKKGSVSAPAPDPAIGQAALKQVELGEDWLEFAEEQYAVANERQKTTDDIANQVTQQQLSAAKQAQQWSEEDRARYEDIYQPVEDAYVAEASNYDTQERQDNAAAEAKADVINNYTQQQEANKRSMAAMGVNPNSGRFNATTNADATNLALSAAGAENTARQNVRDKGLALKADVANMGKGYASTASSNSALATSTGSTALNTNMAANQQSMNNANIVSSGYQGAMSGYNSQASILNTQYQNQMNAWSAQNQANSNSTAGLYSGLGTFAGMAMMSDEEVKTDKKPVAKSILQAIDKMRVENWRYTPEAGQDDGQQHMGTYAQDFQKETGLGDGKSIPVVDAVGVTMKGIQELNAKVNKLAKAKGVRV